MFSLLFLPTRSFLSILGLCIATDFLLGVNHMSCFARLVDFRAPGRVMEPRLHCLSPDCSVLFLQEASLLGAPSVPLGLLEAVPGVNRAALTLGMRCPISTVCPSTDTSGCSFGLSPGCSEHSHLLAGPVLESPRSSRSPLTAPPQDCSWSHLCGGISLCLHSRVFSQRPKGALCTFLGSLSPQSLSDDCPAQKRPPGCLRNRNCSPCSVQPECCRLLWLQLRTLQTRKCVQGESWGHHGPERPQSYCLWVTGISHGRKPALVRPGLLSTSAHFTFQHLKTSAVLVFLSLS